ncbi:MAG: B12-binding domain-containing radical SAM protein [Candidatus Aminicenantes bacterium]|nr:B12-binding domain-containing radical SAM protein [Candidatus Aminicenantes bacterium]
MKVLLVYPGYIVREQPLNILYIAAAVKASGHQTRIFEITPYRKRPLWGDQYAVIKNEFLKAVRDFQPDLAGFSVMSVNTKISFMLATLLKEEFPRVPVVFGGIHPTVAPEETIREKSVDIICRGEGEETITELLETMEAGGDITGIQGLWVKKEDKIHKNPLRPLIQNINNLPFPDRALLRQSRLNAELYGVNVVTSRGCPFPCSYCQNKFLMDIYKGKGAFVRYRNLDNIFSELDEIIKTFHPSRFSFSDESFTLNKDHLRAFCKEYPKRYSIPFLCQTRPDLVDEESLRLLRNAGCDFMNMAIEAGNPRIRNQILKRNISTSKIIEAFRLARKFGIRTGSFNMIGLPDEDMDTMWDTINLNRILQPERIMCTIFMPFQGTELGERCLADNWLISPIDDSEVYYSYVSIKHPRFSGKTLFGYQGFFDYYVRLSPTWYPLIHALRYIYELLPVSTHHLPPLVRAGREYVIDLVYRAKGYLPGKGFFMKTR